MKVSNNIKAVQEACKKSIIELTIMVMLVSTAIIGGFSQADHWSNITPDSTNEIEQLVIAAQNGTANQAVAQLSK